MHAYLLIGKDEADLLKRAGDLAKEKKGEVLEFSIKKIDDVRSLTSFIKLKLNKPTCILIKNIDEATSEAHSALLKNLEEPQEEITFILTAGSEYGVLPTISSRCQIIKVGQLQSPVDKKTQKFLEMKKAEKLKAINSIKKRDEAKKLLEDTIIILHERLHSSQKNKLHTAKNIKLAQNTLSALKRNANVALQLARYVAKS